MKHDTVRIKYASSTDASFHGYVETTVTREEWNGMTPLEQSNFIDEVVAELVNVWVEDD